MTIILSPDQQKANDDVWRAIDSGKRESLLVGPAGSGKTELLKYIIAEAERRGRKVVLVCPTGKGALVMSKKTGRPASTIHRAIYGSVEEDDEDLEIDSLDRDLKFGDKRPPCGPGDLVLCDEIGMAGLKVYGDLVEQTARRKGAQILGVGDREQLMPVKDQWGADFDNPDAALTQVHRQAAGSPIIQLATAIRQRQPFTAWVDGCDRVLAGPDADPVSWLTGRVMEGADATLLCYGNKRRQEINRDIRSALGLTNAVSPGDRVICLLNSRLGIPNGMVMDVQNVSRGPRNGLWLKIKDGPSILVNPWLLGTEPRQSMKPFQEWSRRLPREIQGRAVHIDYGWCLTVHKAQGSEWDEVGFVADGTYRWLKRKRPDEGRRLAYTAVTRAARWLRIFEEPGR